MGRWHGEEEKIDGEENSYNNKTITYKIIKNLKTSILMLKKSQKTVHIKSF